MNVFVTAAACRSTPVEIGYTQTPLREAPDAGRLGLALDCQGGPGSRGAEFWLLPSKSWRGPRRGIPSRAARYFVNTSATLLDGSGSSAHRDDRDGY
jgi:hypothetical protein